MAFLRKIKKLKVKLFHVKHLLRKEIKMTYSTSEGLFVILITIVGMGTLLALTRKTPWHKMDLFLLILTGIFYLLDTVWWWFNLHFYWSDIYFTFGKHREQLTIFFILAGISFGILMVLRLKRKTRQH
ncbi:hypothetical protein [Enterococcus canintestini]|nr:hypothetical protein [Enterococcus canintestini]